MARKTGLSIATISKFLNGGHVLGPNRSAIEDAIQELGYRVNEAARGLKTNRTLTVGVLIPRLENIFCTSIVAHVENILNQSGYGTIICDYQENPKLEREKLEFLVNKNVDALLYMPLYGEASAVEAILKQEIPVILLDRPIAGLSCDMVLVDNLNASYRAIEELVVRGHRQIGVISGPTSIFTAQERFKGYRRVLEDYAVEFDESLVKYGDYQIDSGFRLMTEFLHQNPRPTAVFVSNYEMTLGAVMAINEAQVKVPTELSLIGFDNLQMAKVVKPTLAIVVQPMELIGETSATLLLKRLRGDREGFPAMFRLKTEFLHGDSITGPSRTP